METTNETPISYSIRPYGTYKPTAVDLERFYVDAWRSFFYSLSVALERHAADDRRKAYEIKLSIKMPPVRRGRGRR